MQSYQSIKGRGGRDMQQGGWLDAGHGGIPKQTDRLVLVAQGPAFGTVTLVRGNRCGIGFELASTAIANATVEYWQWTSRRSRRGCSGRHDVV